MNAGDDGADRWQVYMIIGVDISEVRWGKRMIAMRAGSERCFDDPIRVLSKRTRYAGTTGAGLFATVRQIGFLAFRGQQARVIGVLGW
jgi:hypothetical protein